MAEAISKSNLINCYEIFREIIQASTLPSLNSKFSSDDYYYEFDPLILNRNFDQFPHILIEQSLDDSKIPLSGDYKRFDFVVTISVRMEDHAVSVSGEARATGNINRYVQAIVSYINENQVSLLSDYGIDSPTISVTQAVPVFAGLRIHEKVIEVRFNYEGVVI